jgi:hypothetical protein
VEHNMLTWNIPNWITVVLMVGLGYLLVSLVAQLVRGRLGTKAANDDGGAAMGGTSGAFAGVFGASPFQKAA